MSRIFETFMMACSNVRGPVRIVYSRCIIWFSLVLRRGESRTCSTLGLQPLKQDGQKKGEEIRDVCRNGRDLRRLTRVYEVFTR